MCKFFNSHEESLHLGVCKLAKYVSNCVVFWKNLHSWQNFYTTAGRDGRDKFHLCKQTTFANHPPTSSPSRGWFSFRSLLQVEDRRFQRPDSRIYIQFSIKQTGPYLFTALYTRKTWSKLLRLRPSMASCKTFWKWYFENCGRACEIWHRIYGCFFTEMSISGRGE